MKTYYINYDEKAKVNYSFIFALYRIAETDKQEKIGSIITYSSQRKLADTIKAKTGFTISAATISRILLNKEEYQPYLSKSETENKIILNNNFKKGKAASNKFVVLSETELLFLLE